MQQCGLIVTAIDNVSDYWPKGMFNRHFHVMDQDILTPGMEGQYDMITCVSVLAHVEDSAIAVRNMFKMLKPKGHLVLTFPYNEQRYVPNVYKLAGSSYGQESQFATQVFSRNQVSNWMHENNARVVEQEYWRFWSGDLWTVGEQISPPQQVTVEDSHDISCIIVTKGD